MKARSASSHFAPLLLLALMVRALVPMGWMPVADDTGVIFRICPASVAAPMPADHQMGKHGTHDGSVPRDTCPFGVVTAQGGDLPPPAILPEADLVAMPAPEPVVRGGLRRQRWLSHALARGPPALA